MLKNKKEVGKKLEEILGFLPQNYGLRTVYNDSIGLFKSEILRKSDFYFISCSRLRTDPDEGYKYVLYKDVFTVRVLRQENFKDYSDKIEKGTWCKYEYPLELTETVYPKEIFDSSINNNDDNEKEFEKLMYDFNNLEHTTPFTQMSMFDFSCLMLKVPDSNSNWLNELIKKSNKNDRVTN